MCKKTTFVEFHLAVKIDLVKVVYYLKQVLDLLYTESVTPAEELLYFSLILWIVV